MIRNFSSIILALNLFTSICFAYDFCEMAIFPHDLKIIESNSELINRLAKIQKKYQSVEKIEELNKFAQLNIKMTALSHPESDLSGDVFKAIELNNERISFFIGDVKGHGIPASFDTLKMHYYFDQLKDLKSFYSQKPNVNALETLIYLDGKVDFSTADRSGSMVMSNMILNIKNGVIEYTSGAMPPIFIKRANGITEKIHTKSAPRLGSRDNFCFSNFIGQMENSTIQLMPDDIVVFMSDGVSEAPIIIDGEEVLYGKKLMDVIQSSNQDPTDITQQILSNIKVQDDDVTLLVFQWKP